MSTVTNEIEYVELTVEYWAKVVIAGLIGGLLMGVIMQEIMGMIQGVGALYGLEGTATGWGFHLWHAAVFAAIFGGLFMLEQLKPLHDQVLSSIGLGVIYGLVLWVFAAGIVMPIWMSTIGAATVPALPALDPWSGIGHVLYGLCLGGIAALFHQY